VKHRRRAILVPPFVEDLITEQVLYIAERSVDEALAWEARLRRAIESLGDIVTFAVDPDASARLGHPVHKFVFERTYLIHYRIDAAANCVRLMGFRHGARLPRHGEP
jgi:plasmid stabilization system protein ParE